MPKQTQLNFLNIFSKVKEQSVKWQQNNLGIIIFWIDQQEMKNNFIPSFHKKDYENGSKTTPTFISKNTQQNVENTVKKISFHVEAASNQANNTFPSRYNSISEEGSKSSQQQSSCKSSQTIVIPSKDDRNLLKQERGISPNKYLATSPLNKLPVTTSIIRQNRVNSNNFMPMRATMKNLPLNKSPFLNIKKEQNNAKKLDQTREFQLNSSYRANKTFTEMTPLSPQRGIQREFQKLRQENELLRNQLKEIKKNLGIGTAGKKEDFISNLRDTIKKEDSEIKDLRVKIDIFAKKNTLLTTLIENKDQQISFLASKLGQVESQLKQHKQRNAQKFQKLKERINFMIKSYNELEVKWSQAEMEWLDFKQNWLEEKEMYFQRISFLQEYIGENCT